MWWFRGGQAATATPEKENAPSPKPPEVLDVTSLDFTYITNRLIATGCPHDGPSLKESNKNNVDDLSSWLAAYHPGHFLVWNITDQTA
ncbi:unnamed protein product, partial [Choristocarpus tenellus]